MARPKKDATKVVAQIDVSNEVVQNATQELFKKFEELQKQLAELKAENDALKNTKQVVDDDDIEEITADTDIPVISQTVGKLVLSTDGNGIGTVYRFDGFGEVHDIPFADLKDIVKNKPRFAKEGAYYIANAQAVKKLRLTKEYENIVDNKLFEHILDEKADVVISAYKNAPKLQQEQIVSMIEEKIDRGQDVDGNVLVKIGKLCGKDFLRVEEDDE
jgi:hypothetical protein